jgi:hypothetical protein
MRIRWVIAIILLFLPCAFAEDQVVINSRSWQDVYNGVVYANIVDVPVKFVINYEHGIEITQTLDPTLQNIYMIESEDNPVVANMGELLENKGYILEKVTGDSSELNLILLERSNSTDFLVLDESFGHNAISVGGYASAAGKMTVFANRRNADDVLDFLNDNAESILVYGKLDREVKGKISELPIEEINHGDKFSNNMEIFKRHLKEVDAKQIMLVNGNFIEEEIMAGVSPVLLVGDSRVPDDVIQAVKDSNVKIAIALADVMGNARVIKDEADIKVLVKFAQGRNEQQLPLDIFELPRYNFLLDVIKVVYNIATKQLEVTFSNIGTNYLLFQGTYEIFDGEERVATTADKEGIYVPAGTQAFTLVYDDLDLTEFTNAELTFKSNILMGEDVKAFESVLEKDMLMVFDEYEDTSLIDFGEGIIYNTKTARFQIPIKNMKSTPVNIRLEIVDIIIDNDKETFSSDLIKLSGDEEKVVDIKVLLEDIDFADNPNIHIKARYGEREDALVKTREIDAAYEVKTPLAIDPRVFGGIAVGLIIVVLILFLLGKKKKEDPAQKMLRIQKQIEELEKMRK